MHRSYIIRTAERLIERYQTRDPFEIAREIGLTVQASDIGNVRGFYTVVFGQRFAVLNSALEEPQSRMVLAHELGHDCLHRHFAASRALQDDMLYDMKSQPEREANLFAAALLLDREQALELAREGRTLQEIACLMEVSESLAALRLDMGDTL